MTDQLSKSNTLDMDQDSLLALVSVRPPTPEKCAVCLNSKQSDAIARIDSCSHTFCFSCILEWSKVRAICPLCKQPFTTITRERFAGDIVEEIRVQTPRRPPATSFSSLDDVLNWVNRHQNRSNIFDDHNTTTTTTTTTSRRERNNDLFRQMVYVEWLNTIQALVRRPNNGTRNSSLTSTVRTTNSSSSSSSWSNLIPLDSIRRLLDRYLRQTTSDLRQSTLYSQATRQTVAFRKYIYLNRLFVHSPLMGHNHDTLTVRECSPNWYASNPACLHRLVPFLARELLALLWNDAPTIEHIIQEILSTIQQNDIRSNILERKLNEFLGRYTKHFVHEFYTFARCPYDLLGFDRHAQYPTVQSSSRLIVPPLQIALDDDTDEDEAPIILDETNELPTNISETASSSSSSSSSSSLTESQRRSSSSECEIVQYIEPSRERIPTVILSSEDDDDNDNQPYVRTEASNKRKHHRHEKKSKKKHSSTVVNIDPPTSVVLDGDSDDVSEQLAASPPIEQQQAEEPKQEPSLPSIEQQQQQQQPQEEEPPKQDVSPPPIEQQQEPKEEAE